MSGPAPWKCPECRAWVAPYVTEHRCDPPAAMVSVTSIDPPGTGGSFAATVVPPGTITVNVTGSVVSEQELARTVQRGLLRLAANSRAFPGRAA